MTTDRDNLAAILLAISEDRAEYQVTGGSWVNAAPEEWYCAEIRDNIARFRIKPDVVDVVALLAAEIATARKIRDSYDFDSAGWHDWNALGKRLTALAESIRGMQG